MIVPRNTADPKLRIARPLSIFDQSTASGFNESNLTFLTASGEVQTLKADTNVWVAAAADAAQIGGVASGSGQYTVPWSQPETDSASFIAVRLLKAGVVLAVLYADIDVIADEIDRRHGQGRYGGAYPLTIIEAIERSQYGTPTNGWLFDDVSGGLAAAYGAIALVESGAPTYRVEGMQGPADFGVRVGPSGSGEKFQAPSSADLDVGAGDDLFLRFAMRDASDGLPQISKYAGVGVGSSGWRIVGAGGIITFSITSVGGGGSGSFVFTLTAEQAKRGFILVAGASRATSHLGVGIMTSDGTFLVPGAQDNGFTGGLTLTNTGKFTITSGGGSSGVFSHLDIGVGVDVALGVPENIEAVTRDYWEQVFGRQAIVKADVIKFLGADAPAPSIAGIPKVEDATVRGDTSYLIALGEEQLYGSIDWDVKVPTKIEVPTVGTRTYRIEISGRYEDSGAVGVDADMTLALVNQAGVDRSARLDSTTMANPTYGTYRAIYTATAGDPNEELLFRFTGNATPYNDTRAVSRWAVSVVEQSIEDAVWDALPVNHMIAGSFGEILANPTGAVVTDAGNTAITFKTNLTNTQPDAFRDAWCCFLSGALVGQVHKVTAYDATTKFLTFTSPFVFSTPPANTDRFVLINK